MEAMEIKSVERPIIIFVGKDVRKSSSAYRDVRIPKNINTEFVEEKSDIASETINTTNIFSSKNKGKPVPPLFPPGTVKAAANMMVIVRAPTIVQEVAFMGSHTLFIGSSHSRG
ncbi:unnamed protein product [Prunus armeniaca]|uniref:Uncharacterized protein n=1 Tax=Prunus armeniaca TaxID=36596 RepID=A0A6J5TXU7_PRUAR|nr:unnamed protein product [Prunus armeniaca]